MKGGNRIIDYVFSDNAQEDQTGDLLPRDEFAAADAARIMLDEVEEFAELSRDVCLDHPILRRSATIIGHDLRNQGYQITNALTYAGFEEPLIMGAPTARVLYKEVEAYKFLRAMMRVIKINGSVKFPIDWIAKSIYVYDKPVEIIAPSMYMVDAAAFFSVRTLVLNSKGKGDKLPSKIAVMVKPGKKNTEYRIYDDCRSTEDDSVLWPDFLLKKAEVEYRKGWDLDQTLNSSTDGGAGLLAYVLGQKAKKAGYSGNMYGRNTLLVYKNPGEHKTKKLDEFKYVAWREPHEALEG